ncbi:hypothetical protein IHE45_12G027000 [Dioscorea alata]|uniref:Uncharacterized protein n=1 Tax=Dioscorea alata TaxID=55571 RepID=A0ACB7V0Z5_DIOAL|nr:hypothetical protein IHE45_12G027000 [Dioscorea alata]
MESKKENPMGMCEKLFNVFNVNNSAFRPLRRLTFKNQEQPPTTTPNQSPPNKPPQVLENNNHNPSSHDHHHHEHQHHDTPSLPPKTIIESQQINNTLLPPPNKPLDEVQVKVPSKIEIQNQQTQQKVPMNPLETGKVHRKTTLTKKEKAPPPTPPPPSVPTSVAPKVTVAPQAQFPVPTPPVPEPEMVAGRRQPQRLETKNIDGKADDFINRVRNKLRNGSNVGKATSN